MFKKYTKSKTPVKRSNFKKTTVRRRPAPRMVALKPEIKWITGTQEGKSTILASASTDVTVLGVSNGTIKCINIATPSMGNSANQRIGNAITCYSLDIALEFTNLKSNGVQDFRVIVFLDKQMAAQQPTAQDLLALGANNDLLKMSLYPIDPVKDGRFKILHDSYHIIDPFGLGQGKIMNLKLPIRNTVIRFSKPGDTTFYYSSYADVVSNWIGLAIIPSQFNANDDGVKVYGISTLKYTDA